MERARRTVVITSTGRWEGGEGIWAAGREKGWGAEKWPSKNSEFMGRQEGIEEVMREEIEGKKRRGEGRCLGNLRKVMKT